MSSMWRRWAARSSAVGDVDADDPGELRCLRRRAMQLALAAAEVEHGRGALLDEGLHDGLLALLGEEIGVLEG
jgi:hypothetical protein